MSSNLTSSANVSSKKRLDCSFFYLFPQLFPQMLSFCMRLGIFSNGIRIYKKLKPTSTLKKQKMKIIKITLSMLVLLSVISCINSEPSGASVSSAVTSYMSQPPRIFGMPLNDPSLLNVVHDVKKLSCTQLGSKEFTCLVQITMTTPVLRSLGPQTQNSRVHIVKQGSDWIMLSLIE